jgi:FixJ family two-component response regulator
MAASIDPAQPCLALVEDDARLRVALTRLLRCAGFEVEAFASAEAFQAATGRHACLILDVQLPGLSGLELAEQLDAAGDRTPIVFVSGCCDTLMQDVRRRTGRPCLAKPVDEAALLAVLAMELRQG